APAGTNNTVSVLEDGSYTFAAARSGVHTPNSSHVEAAYAALLSDKNTTLPGAGSLTNNGVAVTAGQFVSAADITAGKRKFSPARSEERRVGKECSFQVQADRDTDNSGVDLDQSDNTLTIDVTSDNDAPAGTSHTTA